MMSMHSNGLAESKVADGRMQKGIDQQQCRGRSAECGVYLGCRLPWLPDEPVNLDA